jgi:hypothetical protein
MKIKTILLFVCVSLACLAVQVGIYKGIIKAQTPDPCPQYVTVASTPCPFPEGAILHDHCEQSNCTGYIAYAADTLNTGAEIQEGSETWTTSTSYDSPDGYNCATYTICIKELNTEICHAHTYPRKAYGKLYTMHSCDD